MLIRKIQTIRIIQILPWFYIIHYLLESLNLFTAHDFYSEDLRLVEDKSFSVK